MSVNKTTRNIFWGCLAAGSATLVGAAALRQKALQDDPLAPARAELASLQGMGTSQTSRLTQEGASAKSDVASPEDNTSIARVVGVLMGKSQYLHEEMTPVISARFFDLYLDALDPQHLYFTKQDLAEWEKWRTNIGPMLYEKGDTAPAQVIFDRLKERNAAQVAYVTDALKSDTWKFDTQDTISIDRKKAPRPLDLTDAKTLWEKRLRYEYLTEKLNKQKPDEIVKTLSRRYTRIARALKEQDGDDIFELYVDNFTRAYDPHSDYFGKSTTENFSIQMQLSLFGIGATLQSEDGYVKVAELSPGGPAAKGNKLKPGDRIVAVTQGQSGGEPVDVVDMKLNKVVEMIRGPKDTYVRLTVLPAGASDGATRQNVVIKRDKVQLDAQAAKAQIIDIPAGGPSNPNKTPLRLGVVVLPSFYQGEDNSRSATADVKKLLIKLKAENVAGIIFDLRNNGGGSLQEAIGITGLFIKQGPVVQVRTGTNKIQVDTDDDPSVAYDGPLVVLTNRFSASASEIVAGALQDYGRSVTVGDKATFGKGSVQAVVDLKRMLERFDPQNNSDPGTLHLTIQKFYRPGGATTQLKGVVSDIALPSLSEISGVGEKSLDYPLPFDTIAPASFSRTGRASAFLPQLKISSAARVGASPDWKYLSGRLVELKKNIDTKTFSLNEAQRVKERDTDAARSKARQKVLAARAPVKEKIYAISLAQAAKPGLPAPLNPKQILLASTTGAAALPTGDDATSDDAVTLGGKPKADKLIPERDFTLDEARNILADYIKLSRK